TSIVDGYLAQGDFANFTAKPPNTRTISTSLPLTGGGDLSANRTIAIPKASPTQDGYLAAADFGALQNNVAVLAGNGSARLTIANVAPPVTRVVLNVVLTQRLQVDLPLATGYNAATGYPFIEFVDVSGPTAGTATASFGITLNRTGSDLIDGATSIDLPRGSGYWRVNSNSTNRWSSTQYVTNAFRDSIDPTHKVVVDLTNFPAATPTRTLTPASGGNSGTVVGLTKSVGQFVTGYDPLSGLLGTDPVHVYDLVSTQDDITAGQITSNAHTVPNSGLVDNDRLSASLTAPLAVTWPSASTYTAGEIVRFYAASSSINSTNFVTIVANPNGTGPADIINGLASITISEQYSNRVFVADPATNSWTASQFSGANQGVTIAYGGQLVENTSAHPLTWPISQGVNYQTATAIPAATATLQFNGSPVPGMKFELALVQPASGGPVTINLPFGSRTPTNGLGVLDLSTAANAVDKITGTYYG